MIIKSVFRRYERWNPVHPTYGAFWGIGVGIGCGVGWGPGFGPEVIGYVGAGCGVGFSVGFTLLGLGIGLPTNYLFTVPHNAFMVTRQGVLDVAQVLGNRGRAGDGWGDISSLISDIQHNQRSSFSGIKIDHLPENIIDFDGMKSMMAFQAKRMTDCVQRVSEHIFPLDGGSKS